MLMGAVGGRKVILFAQRALGNVCTFLRYLGGHQPLQLL